MGKVIDGEKLAESIKDETIAELINISSKALCNGQRPNLAIILVGAREDSKIYVGLKEKEAKKVGVDTHLYKFDEKVSEEEVKETIKFLNKDPDIDAILLQLPLPVGFNTAGIIELIDPKKDVDCLHPDNRKTLAEICSRKFPLPPLFQVVLKIAESLNYNISGKKACIVANSEIFREALAKVLECRGAQAETVSSDDKDLKTKTRLADILITAIGKKHLIKKEDIKEGALIVDIGIVKEGKKVFGDVDFEGVKAKAGFITPVPGGVGPMTVAIVLHNAIELYKTNKCKKA